MLLKELGVSVEKEKGELSQADEVYLRIKKERTVPYIGKLAGYPVGVHESGGGESILITRSPKMIEPKQGEFPMLTDLIVKQLGDEQTQCLYGWLKVFLEDIRGFLTGDFKRDALRPGQVLILAGPAGCGKTFLVRLLTLLTGGRKADPMDYMLGKTDFNGELAESEWLVIDDRAASRDPRDRNVLSSRCKEFTVSGSLRIHAKFCQAQTLSPYQRMVICVNDEPENLMVLPIMEPSIADKLMLFKASSGWVQAQTGTTKGRSDLGDKLKAELPAFMYYLLHEHEIVVSDPKLAGRFGIEAYHHPDLISELNELAVESSLLQVIDSLFEAGRLFKTRTGQTPFDDLDSPECRRRVMANIEGIGSSIESWEGPASVLEEIIRKDRDRNIADKLFPYTNSCGSLLSRLHLQHPDRVEKLGKSKGYQRWRLNPRKDNECQQDE